MNMINPLIIDVFLWIAQFLYFACFIPQIVTNARLKSASGVSTGLLLAFFNGYGTFYLYSYPIGLPLAYQLLAPLQGVALVILIIQRFWYDQTKTIKWPLIGYTLNTLFFLVCIPFVIKQPELLSGIFGWISFVLFLICQLPQTIKVYHEKSVQGFSYGFVFIQGIAAMLETVGSFVGGLPVQTCMMALRGVALFVIFSIQFALYKNNTPR